MKAGTKVISSAAGRTKGRHGVVLQGGVTCLVSFGKFACLVPATRLEVVW